MLKLKNVSKFYYSKGIITSGFSKVDLELDMGEFAVITGESGSGKSTLLNVLSGLDTYEEGEMYVNGEETSHYNEADFEEYRRKYVGNVFQNFNLVNSYTVYENVELALLLNGEKKKDARQRVLDIIRKVGLEDFASTKCAKLSGGQKQRVAIARALAKETPIIVADEPTGNLDTESAAEVIKLLSEISKDKLVIIVTHNLEQVEKYATRLIRMHDGKIIEDKKVKASAQGEASDGGEAPAQTAASAQVAAAHAASFSDVTLANRLRLGARNAFNIPAKFVLIFVVFLFIALAISGTYASFQKAQYDESVYGFNAYFSDNSDKRIIVKKTDGSVIGEEDFQALAALDNVERIAKNDVLVDYVSELSDKNYDYWLYGSFHDIGEFKGKPDVGRMPEADNEMLLECSEDSYYLEDEAVREILERDFYFAEYDSDGERVLGEPMKVVGIIKNDEFMLNDAFYASGKVLDTLSRNAAIDSSNVTSLFNGREYPAYSGDAQFFIEPNEKVPAGSAFVSSDLNYEVENGSCVGREIRINVDNVYNEDSLTVKISNVYNKYNFTKLTGLKYRDSLNGTVYINDGEYERLLNKGIYQSSVYVDDVKKLDETEDKLQQLGYDTLAMRNALARPGEEIMQMMTLTKTFVLAMLILALFFISYFIIRIVLKSRNSYYATLRTLGASRRISKQLLDIELFLIATLAYAVFMILVSLVYAGVITQSFIADIAGYMSPANYVLIYLAILVMSYLIAHRFSRKLFKDSVMNTFREEA